MEYKNKEAKASQGGTTENERKYSILGLIRKYKYIFLVKLFKRSLQL